MKLDKYIHWRENAPVIGILTFNSKIFIRDYIRVTGASYIELANLEATTTGEMELTPEDEQSFVNQSYQQVVMNCRHQLEDMATIANRYRIGTVFAYLPLNPRHQILIDTILQALADTIQLPISVYYGFDHARYTRWKNQNEKMMPQSLNEQITSMLSATSSDHRTFLPAPSPSVKKELEASEKKFQRRNESLTPVVPRSLSTYLYVSVTESLIDIVEDDIDLNPKYLYVIKGTRLSDGWLNNNLGCITFSGIAISVLIVFLPTTTSTTWKFALVLMAISILVISSISYLASRMFTTETIKTFETKSKAETYAGILLYGNSEETFKGESLCRRSLLSRLALVIFKFIQRLTK